MSIQEQAEQILARVRDAGAEGDLIIDRGQALSLKARDGDLEEHKVTSSRVFGLRVIRDNRVGTAYSEAADPESLSSLVDQALTNASYAATEVHEKILANRVALETDDALLCPPEEVPVEAKIELALQIETSLAGRPRVKNVPYNGVQDSTGDDFTSIAPFSGFGELAIFEMNSTWSNAESSPGPASAHRTPDEGLAGSSLMISTRALPSAQSGWSTISWMTAARSGVA